MKEIFAKFMGDGSHCGLTDFYEPQTKKLAKAIKLGKAFSTGWWASKKEIASAKLEFDGKKLWTVTVSVSDDFDTEGLAEGTFEATNKEFDVEQIMEKISDCIYETWDRANENQKENQTWAMYCIGEVKKSKRINWVETYLVDIIGDQDCPPGDSYDKWGWQGDSKLPVKIKEKLEDGMFVLKNKVRAGKYVAELVND